MDFLTELLPLILGSGIAAALSTFALDFLRTRADRKSAAKHLALQICVQLERFAILAEDKLSEHELYVQSMGHAGKALTFVPDFPELPQVEHLRHLPIILLDKAMNFPDRVFLANREVGFTWQVADGEDAHSDSQKVAVLNTRSIAIEALSLADELRSHYRLPKRSLKFGDINIRDGLRSQHHHHDGLI